MGFESTWGFLTSVFGLVMLGAVLIAVKVVSDLLLRNRREARLLAHGNPGQAVLLSVADTGTLINNQPLLRLVLQALPQSEPPREWVVEQVIPFSLLARLQPGTQLPVRTAHDDPNAAVVDLAELTQSPEEAAAAA